MTEEETSPMLEDDFIEDEYILDDYDEEYIVEDDEFEEDQFETPLEDDNFGFNKIEKEDKGYETMTVKELIEKQQKELSELSTTLDLPFSIIGTLLRSYQWKKEKLMTDFFEDISKVQKKTGVDLNNFSSKFLTEEKIKEAECPACYDDVPGKDLYSMNCKHFMCKSCWANYLHVAIDDGPSCLQVSCPFPKCNSRVQDKLVSEIVDDVHKEKYDKFLARSFVDDNPNTKWCPAPNCGKIVFCPTITGVSSVVCSCGYNFCFLCGEEGHKPCSCKEVRAWVKKCSDDSETANFIVTNTKDCPKCNRSIEKNGGCNHMTCSLCRHEFCWICLGDWSKHGTDYYNCNRYKEKDVDTDRENAKTQARAALEKYMHYFTRFATHEQSQKLESKLLQLADQKMKELTQKSQTSWLEVDYIRKGVEQLIECRAALKWTYAYAYYLPSGPQKELFEYLQEELEHNTENLSELLERDSSNKGKILNTTKVAQTRLQHLIKGIDDGLKK